MVSFTKLVTAGLLTSSALALPHGHTKFHQKRSSGKRGAAYNDPSTVKTLSTSGAISWAYNWNMLEGGSLPDGVEYVPMLWGSKMFGGWLTAVETALSSGCKYIMGFNEPDMPSQASMSASDAADSYKKYITPYAGKATLVTPAVSNGNGPGQGLNWMTTFMDACTDCGASILAVHWYGDSADDLKNFVNQAIDFANKYNMKEVWLSEFALNSALNGGSQEQATSFLNDVVPWLDSQPMVGRYAYFMCADGYLISGNTLSSSGQAYTSA